MSTSVRGERYPLAQSDDVPDLAQDPETEDGDDSPARATVTWASIIWMALIFVVGASPIMNLWAVPRNLDDRDANVSGVDDPDALFLLKVRAIVVLGTAIAGTLYVLATGQA